MQSRKSRFSSGERVRDRIEREAREAGKTRITPADVASTQARYLAGMSSEVQGYRIETCFGASGCPNRAVLSEQLFGRLERVLKKEDLLGFLKERVAGDLKFHHEFRVTLADCPNACSQPQIRDVGIIGACVPELTAAECRLCGICTDTCREKAIALDPERRGPRIAIETCINCGRVPPGLPHRNDCRWLARVPGATRGPTRATPPAGPRAARDFQGRPGARNSAGCA